MNIKPQLILTMLFSLVAFEAYAASFDCNKARTRVEKAICSNQQLSDLDELLALSYKKALANTRNKRSLRRAQRSWVKRKRNRCRSNRCIKKAYRSRISKLKKSVAKYSKYNSISGKYKRNEKRRSNTSADLTILKLKNGRVRVTGDAVWEGNVATGLVSLGDLDGSFPLKRNKLYYNKDGCRLTIAFLKNALIISNDNSACGGMNVTFNGKYRKVGR